ncbi:UDP-glucose 4-epimerase family protein [Pseudoalteromonas xiamenensis]
MSAKILLTGYSGFVGHHFLNVVQASDSLNLLGRSTPPAGYKYLQANIDATSDYTQVLEGVSVVIHIAARVHVMRETGQNAQEEFRAVNTIGTLNLAEQAAKKGVNRFIFVSSVKVNGESTTSKSPFRFDDEHHPEDPYGISKSEAEQKLFDLGKETGMEIVVIRPPLVYGEGVKANFGSLMKFASRNIPLPFGAISANKRSLVSVYNLVDLIRTCMEHPKAANQTFLVSDDNDLSTKEMVELMAKVQGKKLINLPVPVKLLALLGRLTSKQAVVDRLIGSLQVDISHTKDTLGWVPPYSVEHGFKLAAKGLKDK